MRRLQVWVSASLFIAAITALTVFIGCEDEPQLADIDGFFADNEFESGVRTDGDLPLLVSPIQESISVIGQKVSFRAKGAVEPVSWSVASAERGIVSTVGLRTDYVIYEAVAVADNTIVAVDAAGRTATAAIRAGANPLEIIPDQVTLLLPGAGPAAEFTVTGGVPPYSSWRESFPQLGIVSPGGTYYVMTALVAGTNVITISDSAGDIASAIVQHVLDFENLTIVPSTTSLSFNGERAIFIGSGGLPPYSWSVVYPSRGQIVSGASSTIMEYQRDDEGDQVIVLEDAQGDTTQAQVSQAAPTPPVIQPTTVTLATNQLSYAFTASGGTPPYSWLVLTGGAGTVTPNTGTSVVYTRTAFVGNSIIRVTDSASQSALATITQQ